MAFERRLLTKKVQEVATGIAPVGLIDIPPNVGWNSQSTNTQSTKFRPFAILAPGTASVLNTGGYSRDENDWRCTYTLASYGVSAEQTELVADSMRNAIEKMTSTRLVLENNYLVQQVRVSNVGSVQAINSADLPYYLQVDTYEIWISKEM